MNEAPSVVFYRLWPLGQFAERFSILEAPLARGKIPHRFVRELSHVFIILSRIEGLKACGMRSSPGGGLQLVCQL
jgi:hypothetical protein